MSSLFWRVLVHNPCTPFGTESYASGTRLFSNGTPPNQLRTNWIGIKWRAWSWLERTASATHSYNVHKTLLRQISRMTLGTTKKPEFQCQPEDFHLYTIAQQMNTYAQVQITAIPKPALQEVNKQPCCAQQRVKAITFSASVIIFPTQDISLNNSVHSFQIQDHTLIKMTSNKHHHDINQITATLVHF